TTVTVPVTNNGNSPAGDFIVKYQPFGLAQALTSQVNGLAVGETRNVTFQYTFPFPGNFAGTATADSTNTVPEVDETNNTLAGNFRTQAHVDAFDTNKESNEKNNLRLLYLTVDPAPIDLVITSFKVNNDQDVVRGVATTASVEVTNFGPLATGPFAVQVQK